MNELRTTFVRRQSNSWAGNCGVKAGHASGTRPGIAGYFRDTSGNEKSQASRLDTWLAEKFLSLFVAFRQPVTLAGPILKQPRAKFAIAVDVRPLL